MQENSVNRPSQISSTNVQHHVSVEKFNMIVSAQVKHLYDVVLLSSKFYWIVIQKYYCYSILLLSSRIQELRNWIVFLLCSCEEVTVWIPFVLYISLQWADFDWTVVLLYVHSTPQRDLSGCVQFVSVVLVCVRTHFLILLS